MYAHLRGTGWDCVLADTCLTAKSYSLRMLGTRVFGVRVRNFQPVPKLQACSGLELVNLPPSSIISVCVCASAHQKA